MRSTLRAVIAQRLVRRLCERCRSKKVLCADDLCADPRYAAVGFEAGETVCEPGGCESCGGSGYRGRLGIFELLVTVGSGAPVILKSDLVCFFISFSIQPPDG